MLHYPIRNKKNNLTMEFVCCSARSYFDVEGDDVDMTSLLDPLLLAHAYDSWCDKQGEDGFNIATETNSDALMRSRLIPPGSVAVSNCPSNANSDDKLVQQQVATQCTTDENESSAETGNEETAEEKSQGQPDRHTVKILLPPPPLPQQEDGTMPSANTSTTAATARPSHFALTPRLMKALQRHMPASKQGDSFWLRYSLVRDGVSLETMLQKVQDSPKYSVLVVETMDGEIFGAFTSEPWRLSTDYYGTGESFLWRRQTQQQHTRDSKEGSNDHNEANVASSDEDGEHDLQCQSSSVEVFKYAFENGCVQLCHPTRIAMGGGEMTSTHDQKNTNSIVGGDDNGYGFGLAFLDKDLSRGTTSSCVTFDSPPLSQVHTDGSWFEVSNLEIWALTPFETIDQAEKMMISTALGLEHQNLQRRWNRRDEKDTNMS